MKYGNKVYVIREIHGWLDDPDEENLLTEAFLSDVDANIYCEKLSKAFTDEQDEFDISEGDEPNNWKKIWRGSVLSVYNDTGDPRNGENGLIAWINYQIIELDLHK